MKEKLLKKIEEKSIVVGVVGLGYVGLCVVALCLDNVPSYGHRNGLESP